MNSLKNLKWDIYKILLAGFTISLIVFGLFTLQQTDIAKVETDAVSLMEKINRGIQRISKLELENNADTALLYELNENILELGDINENPKYFSNEERMFQIIQFFIDEVYVFQDTTLLFHENADRDALFQASESNYQNALLIIKEVKDYADNNSDYVDKLEIYLIIDVIIMALLLIKILLNTAKELKQNKELSKDMFIDTSTGLYNRSKCQEILKSPVTPDNTKERAVVIFDLNDLKKTNDGLGHRAGDDLISSFAAQLKKSTEIFAFEVFVGRYGGDEFMAYFASCEEKDVELYLKEVDYQLEFFNNTAGKQFKLSCAAGYSITTLETKSMKMRELFDIADETMYKNKLAMKERKKQELLAQGIEIPEEKDDRL